MSDDPMGARAKMAPVVSDDEIAFYTSLFGGEPAMLELLRECPECGAPILVPDNGVWLDPKDVPNGLFGIVPMGGLRMAAGGDIDGGSKHDMHTHQPKEKP